MVSKRKYSMKRTSLLLAALVCFAGSALAQTTLSLAGPWQLQLDPADQGVAERFWEQELNDTIQLPNTTARAGKGEPLTIEVNLERPAMQHLHQRHRFVGPAWYRRTVKIPDDWANRDIILTLERVIWESRVWINGREVTGEPQISLTTPHRFDLTAWLKPGQENTITLRIDNREKVPIGVMGHSYTDETQTIWNGVIGRIELEAVPKVRIEHLRLRPDLARGGVEVTLATRNGSGHDATVELSLQAEARNFPAPALTSFRKTLTLATGEASQTVFYPMDREFERWSELNPKLYLMRARLAGEGFRSEMADTFGLREFKASGGQFTINGQRTFLRGDVQCAEFPQTGHPDMTGQQWEKIFATAKAHGLNHMRFHSWCPPQIAFATADRHGFYLHVEPAELDVQDGPEPPGGRLAQSRGRAHVPRIRESPVVRHAEPRERTDRRLRQNGRARLPTFANWSRGCCSQAPLTPFHRVENCRARTTTTLFRRKPKAAGSAARVS